MCDEYHDEGRKMQNYGSLRDNNEGNISIKNGSIRNSEERTPLLGEQSSTTGSSRDLFVNMSNNVYSGFSSFVFVLFLFMNHMLDLFKKNE